MSYTVLSNQSLLDIAIIAFGSAAAAFDIALFNDLQLDAELQTGQILNLPNNALINRQIVAYYAARGLKPATALTNQNNT